MILQYLLTFIILLIIAFLYYKYALKSNILDTPKERSSHKKPTVRGGGIVFFAAVLLFFIKQLKIEFPYFLMGFVLVSILGFIDDKKELSASLRFPFQLLAVGLILYDTGLFSSNLPIIIPVFGYIASVSFLNAFNFMDGINGITGFYTTAVLVPFLYINLQYRIVPNYLFTSLLIGIVVFGFFNFRKNALFFAGDIGSMAMAAVLLFIIVKFIIELNSPILILTVIVYGIDSALTIIYRFLKKEKVTEAHRWHLYQKLVDISKWSHLQVGAVYALIQFFVSIIVITQFIEISITLQIVYLFITVFIGAITYIGLQRYYKNINNL